MAKIGEFHSIHIDIDRGVYEVNGRDVSNSGKELHLDFEDGKWSLVITEDAIFSSDPTTKE